MSFIRRIVPRYWWPWLQEGKKLVIRSLYPARRGFGRWDRAITQRYLRDQPVRKLQLGCGRNALKQVGFTAVRRCCCGESPDPHLRNLEFESRQPAGILRMETLVLEATKAPCSAESLSLNRIGSCP